MPKFIYRVVLGNVMNIQIKSYIGSNRISVFLQDGFFNMSSINCNVHSHSFDEIHIMQSGNATYNIDGVNYSLKDNQAILIPAGRYHFSSSSAKCKCIAFQIESVTKEIKIVDIESSICNMLFCEIEKISDNYQNISLFISHICNLLYSVEIKPDGLLNIKFLIKEFFINNYNREDISLADLANEIKYSNRQTERIVKEITGKTFRENIIAERMTAAKYLREQTSFSERKISEIIGYSTYAGYYKSKQKELNREDATK